MLVKDIWKKHCNITEKIHKRRSGNIEGFLWNAIYYGWKW